MTISDPGYDVLQEPTRAFVFVDLPGEGWAVAARVDVGLVREGRPEASLVYGSSWTARPDAFALDPVNLPMGGKLPPQAPMIGALLDAGPDRWGGRLLEERFGLLLDGATAAAGGQAPKRRRHMAALDRLLLGAEDRVGAIGFGPTAQRPLIFPAAVPVRDLPDIEERMVRFDAGERVERDIAMMAAGTSLGGARPKATVRMEDGSLWIAKFRRQADTFDVVRAEHAMMTLARQAGVDAAETRVASLGSREALLVRRFDRDDQGRVRLPFLSAQSLLGLRDTDDGGSYAEIADKMRQAGCPALDGPELFRRMLVNVACGNTDDHLKNHGLVRRDGRWRLAPAYDVLPCPDGNVFQAISVGELGSTASYRNAVSRAGRFGLGHDEAAAIAAEVAVALSGWRGHFAACGVSDADVRRIERAMGRLKLPPQGSAPQPSPAPRAP